MQRRVIALIAGSGVGMPASRQSPEYRFDRAFNYELWLCFFAGVVRQRWADRHRLIAPGPATLRRSVRPAVAADDRTPAA